MPDYSTLTVSELIRRVDAGTLVVRPDFQRRLAWTNVVKDHFLETVLKQMPFPEIFVATRSLDTQTAHRTENLVDGQQRISTLREYVKGSTDLVLKKVPPYAELPETEKKTFLSYRVAVRDLGDLSDAQVREIFKRINSTDFALNAAELVNAQFSGEYKSFCDTLSRHEFFNRHRVFKMGDVRRMMDLDFCVIVTSTMLSTYYHRADKNREFLELYNDEFPRREEMQQRFEKVFAFIDQCGFKSDSRAWRKTDLLTLIVEIDSCLHRGMAIDAQTAGERLAKFFLEVEAIDELSKSEEIDESKFNPQANRYLRASTRAANDKYSRVERAETIGPILEGCIRSTRSK